MIDKGGKGNFMNQFSRIDRPNRDVREAVQNAGFFQWQLAAELGLSDGALTRRFRTELTANEKEACFKAVERMKEQRERRAENREA